MPYNFSFEVVSNFDKQDVINLVNQINSEIVQRYDCQDSAVIFNIDEDYILISVKDKVLLQLINKILLRKTIECNLSLKIFDFQSFKVIEVNQITQKIKLRKGLSQEIAKKLSKKICNQINTVTVKIQDNRLVVNGNTKNDLQQVINLLKFQDLDFALQLEDYRQD